MTSLDIFTQYQITSLPFNPMAVARQMNVRVVQYSSFCKCFDCTEEYLLQKYKKDGFTISVEGNYIIAYNQNIHSIERQRWTLTHELCHIILGHIKETEQSVVGEEVAFLNDRMADKLTAELLCPLAVVHLCSASNSLELRKLCGISMQAADNRLQELQKHRRLGSIMSTKQDVLIVNNFISFISDAISRQQAQKRTESRYKNIDVLRS